MQCTSMYPCPDQYIGLNVIEEFKKRYKLKSREVMKTKKDALRDSFKVF